MATVEQAKEMVKLTRINEEFVEFYKSSFVNSFTQLTTGFPPEFADELEAIKTSIKKVYDNHEHVISSMTESTYVSNYSDAEADAIIKFLDSDEGRMFLTKQSKSIIDVDEMLYDYEREVLYPEIKAETDKLIQGILNKTISEAKKSIAEVTEEINSNKTEEVGD